jgi:Zn-dependent alcohol dehydrogenase
VPTKTPRRKTAMKSRAAVALEKSKPLTVTEVELDGPKAARC